MRSTTPILAATFLASFIGAAGSPARAEVTTILRPCDGRLCPMFRPMIAEPEGWEEDRRTGRQRGLVVMVPKGKSFETTDVVIYARAQFNPGNSSLESFIKADQEQWRGRHPEAQIKRLGEVSRAGGEVFHDYRFAAPSLGERYERVATTADTDKDGNVYFVSIVLTGFRKQAIDKAQTAYSTILRTY
jgi:hypothetical protein